MKGAIIVVCFLALAAVSLARPGEHYTDKYDKINLDEILENERLRTGYVHCLLEKGKCTPEGKELKGNMRDALETDCAKCTPAQKDGTHKVITYLIKHAPEDWAELKKKYDPSGEYSKRHEDELNKAAQS